MEKKLKVAFIYKKNYPLVNQKIWYATHYNFFMKALKRNSKIEVTYFPCDNTFDISKYDGVFDVILLIINDSEATPDIHGLDQVKIPVISGIGDPQENLPREEFDKKWKINAYFNWLDKDMFYKYYPKNFQYRQIFFGLESNLFKNVIPFNKRINDKILNSGAVGNTKTVSRLLNTLKNRNHNALNYYKLRTLCNKLSYVDYTPTLKHEFIRDKYTLLLQKYRAAISASTFFLVVKYFEMPASGCLTFMEITKKNNGEILGFKDDKSAIFINQDNYKEKFAEYLNDLENPKWEIIANNGREHALKNFDNDKAVNELVNLMEDVISNF